MHTHPHLLGAEAAHRRQELLAEAARDRLTERAAPLLADRRLHALAAAAALLAGLLLGAGEAAAGFRIGY